MPFLAQATQSVPGTQPATPVPGWAEFVKSPMFLIILMFGVIFWMSMNSKKKQEQKRRQMIESLKRGTTVVTIGGQVGKVVDVEGDRVTLKVDENTNTKSQFLISAIDRVVDETKPETK